MSEHVSCPACGADVTLPCAESPETAIARAQADGDMVIAVRVTDPGTFHAHLRDAHPDYWQRTCEMQRRMNANPNITFMPRKVNGTLLLADEDVGDL